MWAVGICAAREHQLSWIRLTSAGSLVEVLQDRYACGAVLGFLDGMWECDAHVQYRVGGLYLLVSTMLFNLYEGSPMISALPVGLCCKMLSADTDWDASRCFIVMFCR